MNSNIPTRRMNKYMQLFITMRITTLKEKGKYCKQKLH